MMRCGQHFENESLTQSTGAFRYPRLGSGSQYEHCLRKSWIISHEPSYAGQVCSLLAFAHSTHCATIAMPAFACIPYHE